MWCFLFPYPWFEFECFGCFLGFLGYNLGFNDGFCVFNWCYLGFDDGFGGFCVFNWCYLGLDDWFHDNFLCCMYSWSSSQFLDQFVELLCDFLWFEFECFGCFGLLGYNLGFNDGFCVFSWCYLGLDDGFGGLCVFNWCYLGLDAH